MADTSGETLSNRAVVGLLILGLGGIGVPLEISGFYLGLALPVPVLLAVSAALGVLGGWLLSPGKPLKGIVGGVVATLTSTTGCLLYLLVWEQVFQRMAIYDIEMVPFVLIGTFGGLLAARVVDPG